MYLSGHEDNTNLISSQLHDLVYHLQREDICVYVRGSTNIYAFDKEIYERHIMSMLESKKWLDGVDGYIADFIRSMSNPDIDLVIESDLDWDSIVSMVRGWADSQLNVKIEEFCVDNGVHLIELSLHHGDYGNGVMLHVGISKKVSYQENEILQQLEKLHVENIGTPQGFFIHYLLSLAEFLKRISFAYNNSLDHDSCDGRGDVDHYCELHCCGLPIYDEEHLYFVLEQIGVCLDHFRSTWSAYSHNRAHDTRQGPAALSSDLPLSPIKDINDLFIERPPHVKRAIFGTIPYGGHQFSYLPSIAQLQLFLRRRVYAHITQGFRGQHSTYVDYCGELITYEVARWITHLFGYEMRYGHGLNQEYNSEDDSDYAKEFLRYALQLIAMPNGMRIIQELGVYTFFPNLALCRRYFGEMNAYIEVLVKGDPSKTSVDRLRLLAQFVKDRILRDFLNDPQYRPSIGKVLDWLFSSKEDIPTWAPGLRFERR